jgi:HD-GYP domain-containing protein (c-di-GMP phosphodiesterase class II)/PAS domain-containing protein
MKLLLSITGKLTLILVLFCVGLLGSLGTLAYTSGRAGLQEAATSELLTQAIEKQAALDSWIITARSDISAQAESPLVAEYATNLLAAAPASPEALAAHDRLLSELQPHTGSETSFTELFFIEADTGKVLVSTDPSEEGKFKENLSFFINGKREPYVSEMYFLVSLNRPAMTAAAPVKATNGRTLGVLAGRLDLNSLNTLINLRTGLHQTDDFFLTNSIGLLVTQPRFISDTGILMIMLKTEAINRCLGGNSGVISADDYRGVPALISYHWLVKQQMCLIVKIDQAEAFAPSLAFSRTIVLTGGLALVIAIALAIVLSRSFTRPILALQAGAARLGQGDLEYRVALKSQDEIGLLAAEFNKMAASLEKQATERKQAEEVLQESEKRYRTLFEDSPISLWEEDFSAVKQRLDALQTGGVTDLHTYLESHPQEVADCASLIKILDVNKIAVERYKAKDKDDLEKNLSNILSPQSNLFFCKELVAIAEGINKFNIEGRNQTLTGEPVDISLSWSVAPGHESDMSKVLISAIDITERKQAEKQIHEQVKTLGVLYDLSRTLTDMEDFNAILDLLVRQAAEATHVTFARVLLLEKDDLVARAFFPVRVLDHDLQVEQREPLAAYPFLQRVLEENTPQVIQLGNPEADDCAPFFLGIAQTLCVVPLCTRERPLGLLMLGEARDAAREPFTAGKMHLALSIGEQAASTLHRVLLHEETLRRLRNIQGLRDIDHAINSSVDLRLTLSIVIDQVVTQLGVDAADVLLFNPNTQKLEYAAGHGFRSKAIERSRLRLGEGHAGRAALEQHLVSVDNLRKEIKDFVRGDLLAGEDFDSYHCAPLIAKGQVIGVLEVYLHTHRPQNVEWLDFFKTLAGQTAIAVDNASMFANLQHSNAELSMSYDATIEGWSRALDLRDRETEGHSQRVTEMTLNIAREMNISEEELVHVRRGALLHDIGKMGVPDSILFKPGKLTDDEWVVMHRHPQLAFDMLSPIQYLNLALDIPYCHHEKWDGSGYPRGLKGEEIPLAARLFAVVDVYDALTSDRPYRKAWTKKKAFEHIRAGAGSHFDPQVVKAFFQIMDTG